MIVMVMTMMIVVMLIAVIRGDDDCPSVVGRQLQHIYDQAVVVRFLSMLLVGMAVVVRHVDAKHASFAPQVPCVGAAIDQRGADADCGGRWRTKKN